MIGTPVAQTLAGSWARHGLLRMMLLSLFLHGAALVALCLQTPALSPMLAQGRFLAVHLTSPAAVQTPVIKPVTPPVVVTRRQSTKAPVHSARRQIPVPLPTVAGTTPAAITSVTALSSGSGIGFSLGRARSPWAPRAVPTSITPSTASVAMTESPAAVSFRAALDSALSAMLQISTAPVATDTTCQLTISTRTLSCSNDQLRDWIAARLIWEQLPPPEVFGQPPQLALSVVPGANGQFTVVEP